MRHLLAARGLALLLVGQASMAVQAQLACTADFSAFGQGPMALAIVQRPDGSFDASINGVTTNAGGKVVDEPVRPNLDLAADPSGAAHAGFNSAERSLVHLHTVLSLPGSRGVIELPFAPAQVRRMTTFDLVGKTDKFGGQVLLEARGDGGVLLGRVVRRIFVAECR